MALVFFASCSDDIETNITQVKNDNVYVEKTTSRVKTRTTTSTNGGEKDLYTIRYKDMVLDNIPLRTEDVSILKSAKSMSAPIPVSVKGYSRWTVRTTGTNGGAWYTLAISSDNEAAKICGIAPGLYVARDVWLWQTYTLPISMAVVFTNNEYADYTKMGWNPETLNTPGFEWALSKNVVTMKTAARLLKYTTDGAEIFKTYPVSERNIEWNFYYMTVE